jgi:hypothetical protein
MGNSFCIVQNMLDEPACVLSFANADLVYAINYDSFCIEPKQSKRVDATADAFGLKISVVNFGQDVYFVKNDHYVQLMANNTIVGGKRVGRTSIMNPKECTSCLASPSTDNHLSASHASTPMFMTFLSIILLVFMLFDRRGIKKLF